MMEWVRTDRWREGGEDEGREGQEWRERRRK